MWNLGAKPAPDPEAKTGKIGGDLQAPPPDKPKDWKALGILQYRDADGVFEFRVASGMSIPEKLREELHDKHGIKAVSLEAK